MTYANFWKRTAAYLVDAIIYGIATSFIGQIVGLLAGVGLGISTASTQTEPSVTAILMFAGISLCVQLICYMAYYVWPESSSWQATIGKKIFGLKVTDLNGQRISFWRSLGRNLAMMLSTLIVFIGYLMCFWTEKKQCLHDSLANCLVVDTKPSEKHGCVVGIIIGFFVLLFGSLVLGILAAIALPQYTKAVERSRAVEAMTITNEVRSLQSIYQMQHGRYATRWNQLPDFTECAQETSNLCTVRNFTLELEEQGIAAQRTKGYDYRLFRAYDPADKRRDLVCVSHNENAKAFCQNLMQTTSPTWK